MTNRHQRKSIASSVLIRTGGSISRTAARQSIRAIGACVILATALPTVRAAEVYAYDSSHFHAPHGFLWSLGGSVGNAYGRAVEREADGGLVVASLVPPCGSADQANGLFKLGLERFDATGNPVAWSNAGATNCGGAGNNIAFSNIATSNFEYIRDIKEFNGAIYVMVDRKFSPTDDDSLIEAFGTDGHYIGESLPFNTTSGEFGAGLVPYTRGTQSHLTAVATQYATNGVPHIETANYTIGVDGNLALDTSYGTSGYSTIPAPQTCIQPQPCRITAARVTTRKYGTLIPVIGPDIYVVGIMDHNTAPGGANDTNAIVADVRADGSLNATFGTGGFAEIDFNTEDQFADEGRDIAAACDGFNCSGQHLWLLDEAHTHCGIGIGVAELDALGHLDTSFGSGGKRVFGGNIGAPICAGTLADHPYAMVLDGSRLDIVGVQSRNFGSGTFNDPLVATVDAASGAVDSYAFMPFINNSNGGNGPPTRWGDGFLFGLLAVGDGTFIAAGQAHDDFFNVWNLAVAQFSADRIFANGFD